MLGGGVLSPGRAGRYWGHAQGWEWGMVTCSLLSSEALIWSPEGTVAAGGEPGAVGRTIGAYSLLVARTTQSLTPSHLNITILAPVRTRATPIK